MLTNLARRQISVNSNPANSNSATTIDHKKWPLVSVIIPVFNRESTITRAIASVQRQTYKNIQILVIDDGSSDATVDVVRRLTERDQRVTLLRHSSNQGRSAARNTGVRVASGVLVAFLDSDDEWLPEKLQCQVKAWLDTTDREHAVVYCAYRLLLPHYRRKTLPKHVIKRAQRVATYLFCDGGFMQTSGLVLPIDLARTAPFPVGLEQYEDYALLFELERLNAHFICVKQALVDIHWEEQGTRKDGWTCNRAIEFYNNWSSHFSHEAADCFKFENTVLAALRYGKKFRAVMIQASVIRWQSLHIYHFGALAKWLFVRLGHIK